MTFQEGEPPSPVNPPSGCHFHPRCPHVMEVCRSVAPAPRKAAQGRVVACHLYPE
jgi:peptide/nickel transport system ATP-binding protein